MSDGLEAMRELLRSVELPDLPEHECPYLAGRVARQAGFAVERLDGRTHQALMDLGFRRAGRFFYRMNCPACRACVPLRVPVASFRPTRSQRRTAQRNLDVRTEVRQPTLDAETLALYRRYLESQHPGSPQDSSEAGLRSWLYDPVVPSLEVRYLLGDELIGTSVLDVCSESLSSIYHFWAPEHHRRRIGVLSVLREIEHARELELPYYYLGFWIEGAPTMHYKRDYGPHELLLDGRWTPARGR